MHTETARHGNSSVSPAQRRICRGFTLIELLMVIAIISILAGLLQSVLSRSRQAARKTRCASSFRQIGMFHVLYTNDHGDRYVNVYSEANNADGSGATQYAWPFVLAGLYEGGRPTDAWKVYPHLYNSDIGNDLVDQGSLFYTGCPSYAMDMSGGGDWSPFGMNRFPEMSRDTADTPPLPTNDSSFAGLDGWHPLTFYSPGGIAHPSRRGQVTESASGHMAGRDQGYGLEGHPLMDDASRNNPGFRDRNSGWEPDNVPVDMNRHNRAVNIQFYDGHVDEGDMASAGEPFYAPPESTL